MRVVIPLLCFLLCGCSSRVTKQSITDSTGSNRLALIDRRLWSVDDVVRGRQSYDFHSVVWRTKIDGRWMDRLVISKGAFQAGSTHRRWVSEIHSLDATNGTAIIKVAEGDAPEGSPRIRFVYSWREWSLRTNGEVRILRICANPFEKY